MGKKKKKDCLTKFVIFFLYWSYFISNALMIVMVVLRIMSIAVNT
jgi:hypothetical protein